MPFTPEQRQRVLDAIAAGRLRLDSPSKMYAGKGTGRNCDGCGEAITPIQVEYEPSYEDGQSHYLHLGCAGILDAERHRHAQSQSFREDARATCEHAQFLREQAEARGKESARLRDQADVLAREAEAIVEKSRRVKRGEQPGK
jgi:hypothetical protein